MASRVNKCSSITATEITALRADLSWVVDGGAQAFSAVARSSSEPWAWAGDEQAREDKLLVDRIWSFSDPSTWVVITSLLREGVIAPSRATVTHEQLLVEGVRSIRIDMIRDSFMTLLT
jgi:hypothetical protein